MQGPNTLSSREIMPKKKPVKAAVSPVIRKTAQGEPMEIHTPDKPIHSKKEFVVHMLTVVLR